MSTDSEQARLTGSDPHIRTPGLGILGRFVATAASVALLAVAFMLSLVIFAVVASIVLMAGIYLWWKTRELRKQMRERPQGGHIIEGEVIRDSATPDPAQPPSLH